MLKIWIMEQRSRIKNKILEAFLEANYSPEQLRTFAFFKFKCHPYNIIDVSKWLHQLETTWILKLQSLEPLGLNQDVGLSAFL